MKVYLAMAGYDYEGNGVMGVYSTRGLAESFINEMKANPRIHYDKYEVEEHEVDE
jgi:hypothetical protein